MPGAEIWLKSGTDRDSSHVEGVAIGSRWPYTVGMARHCIHFTTSAPGITGKARARCGVWSQNFTTDTSKVTCSVCLRLIRKPATMSANVIKSAAVLFLLTAAACGPLPPDSESESGSATEVETTSGEDEPGSDVSTSTDTTTDASTTGDPTTGECDEPACIAAECDDGETCRPHPTTGHVTCVGPCEAFGVVCEAEVCGELVPGVCVADPLGLGWCFPN